MVRLPVCRQQQSWLLKILKGWPGGERRPENWTIQSYVSQWNQYASAISHNLTGADATRLFQGCAFEAPRSIGNTTDWNVQNAELDGMRSEMALTVADHEVGPDIWAFHNQSANLIPIVYGRQL
jgi:hypothetical protein